MELLVVALLGALTISVLSAGLTARLMRRETQCVHPPETPQVDTHALRHLAMIEESIGSQQAAISRLTASLATQGRAIEQLAAIRGEISELDRMHRAQWQALRHSLRATRPEGASSAPDPGPAPSTASGAMPTPAMIATAPGTAASPAPTSAARTSPPPLGDFRALKELSDEEVDALAPELPAPLPATFREAAGECALPEVELTDEELDALAPELPMPEKPRKRVLPPPKRPPLSSL